MNTEAENFITHIFVENSRNVTNLDIPLSKEHRQHLILTGKNGSGKTSMLQEINKFLNQIENGMIQNYDTYFSRFEKYEKEISDKNLTQDQKLNLEKIGINYKIPLTAFGGTRIEFAEKKYNLNEKYKKGKFILAFFESKRKTHLKIPTGINKLELLETYSNKQSANQDFLQYIVNLKADRSFARDDNELEVVEKIDKWFENLQNRLKVIFDVEKLELRFNRESYTFDILTDDNPPINFTNLSDGYSAILSIVTELLLRMENHVVKSYDLEGIVLIDEIETHLHVSLQKKILPFLIDFFPKIQFIVTTHSPFVLSSLSNATICDLESKIVTTDLSAYSYDALLESYFETDKYSEEIKSKIIEYDRLTSIKEKTMEELEQIRFLKNYFDHAPKYLSMELMVKLQQIELKDLKFNK